MAASMPLNHKTVFVLDHNVYFAQSCNQPIEYDVHRSKGSGFIPAAPICKSMWTCNVEALMEYLRVVFDIYPKDKQLRIVAGGNDFNDWNSPDLGNVSMSKFAHLGPPKGTEEKSPDYNLRHGLATAVGNLTLPTLQQAESLELGEHVRNQGRIICLTFIKSDAYLHSLEEMMMETIRQINSQINTMATSNNALPIDKCELNFVHSVPVGQDIRITERPLSEVTPQLYRSVCTSLSGRHVYNKLMWLCCQHYQLTSTTVTGIPMKEEQNASSSANYDVELLHPAAAHDDMFKSEHAEGLVIPSKEGLPIETAPLKWCTPKSSVVELHNCSAAYRICPVDVNSRPSSCLTNFLLSGRAVMLEQPRRSGTKVISHMLASHGGEIFIHSIPTSRSLLEDPPSIIEGSGGRVTDYRITAFGDYMKANRLAPCPPDIAAKSETKKPYLLGIDHLERSSRFWPLTISETILFNVLTELGPLPELLEKKDLTDEDTVECKKAIYRVVGMESKNDALPVPTTGGSRGKGPKRDEQYRQLWAELEALVVAYADTSENHGKVLECVHECKKPSGSDDGGGGAGGVSPAASKKVSTPKKEDKEKEKVSSSSSSSLSEAESGWQDFDRYKSMTERERRESHHQADKPFQSPPPKKTRTEDLIMRPGGQSLLSMWTNSLHSAHSTRNNEFDGRMQTGGGKAKLYIHLDEHSQEQSG